MLDLAFQFCAHLASSWSQISVCLQWEFQPTRAKPLLRVVKGCVWMGSRKEGRRGRGMVGGGWGGTLHTHLQRWKITMSNRCEGNEIFWCRRLCNCGRPTGQYNTLPFSVSGTELERLQGSALFLLPQNQKQQQQQVETGLRGSICTGKHLTSTS